MSNFKSKCQGIPSYPKTTPTNNKGLTRGYFRDQVSFNKAGYQLLMPGGVTMISLISLLEKPGPHIFLSKSTCKKYSNSKHFQAVLGGKVCYWGLARRVVFSSATFHWDIFAACDVCSLYGCFLKWWYPQNTPKWSFLVGKPMVVGYHHFRKHPYFAKSPSKLWSFWIPEPFHQPSSMRFMPM